LPARGKRAWLLGLALAVPPALAVRADADLWWHLAAGQEILARHLPRHDTWSYTLNGAPWVDHEWLPEIATALAWNAGGTAGLLTLRALGLLALVAAWLAVVVRRLAAGSEEPASVPVLAWFLVGLPWSFVANLCNLRPQTVTWALVPLVVLLVDALGRGGRLARAAPWLLVGTVWLWANTHAGFLFGWGLAGLGLVLSALGWEPFIAGAPALSPAERRTRLVAAALVAVCPLANPYGLDLLRYIARELTAEHPGLAEWRPPDAALWPVLGAAVLVPVGLQLLARARFRPTAWVGLLVATAMAARQAKMVALVLVLGAITTADALAVLWARLRARPDGSELERVVQSWPARLGVLGLLLYLHTSFTAGPPGTISIELRRFPVRAVDWLAAARVTAPETAPLLPLLVPFGWGGEAIYHLATARPGQPRARFQVSMDGRNTTVYPEAMVNRDVRAWRDGDLDTLLASRPQVVLAGTGGPVDRALAARTGWRRAFVTSTGTVWVAEGAPLQDPEAAPPARQHFP
jgi:hypothetical protein